MNIFKIVVTILLVFLVKNVRSQTNIKELYDLIKVTYNHPIPKAARQISGEFNKRLDFLIEVDQKIRFNDPLVLSEDELKSFTKGYFKEETSLATVLENLKVEITKIDIAPLKLITFTPLIVTDYNNLQPQEIEREIQRNISQLYYFEILFDKISSTQDELNIIKENIENAKQLMHLIAREYEILYQSTDPSAASLKYLFAIFEPYLFKVWWDFDNSFPIMANDCLMAIKDKREEINQEKTRIKTLLLNYTSSIKQLLAIQKALLDKEKSEYEKAKKELEDRYNKLVQLRQRLTTDSLVIADNKAKITSFDNRIVSNNNQIQQIRTKLNKNQQKINYLDTDKYLIDNFTCSQGYGWNECKAHANEKLDFRNSRDNKVKALRNENTNLRKVIDELINSNNSLISQTKTLNEQTNTLIQNYNIQLEQYKQEKQQFETSSKIFLESLKNLLILSFYDNNNYNLNQTQSFEITVRNF